MRRLETQGYLDVLDPATRRELVRAALADPAAELTSWDAADLVGGASSSQLHRVFGTAASRGTEREWSMVLKFFTRAGEGWQASSSDPRAWDYWKREWQAYQAPWVRQLSTGLMPPRCLGAGECGELGAWVAMEDLSTLDRRPWTPQKFVEVAQVLGSFTGSCLADHQVPADPWLCRGYLRGWTERAEPQVRQLAEMADHPAVSAMFPDGTIADLQQLWSQREGFLAALDALPQVFCHYDVFPRNAFVPGSGQVVAVDWALCGFGPVGAELTALIGASMAFFELAPDRAGEVERTCLRAYRDGLAAAGATVDRDQVLLGYLGTIVLRYTLGVLGPILTTALDPALHPLVEHIFGRPMAAFSENTRQSMQFYRPRIAEARRLLAAAPVAPASTLDLPSTLDR